jgi:hypothetical protein
LECVGEDMPPDYGVEWIYINDRIAKENFNEKPEF